MRIGKAIIGFVALILALGCGRWDGEDERDAVPQFIVDTDMNFDDAMAILYLLGRDDIEVTAITVTGTGMARLEAGTKNALRLLELADRADIPVAPGSSDPLAGSHPDEIPSDWRDDADTMMGIDLPEASAQARASAVDLLTTTVRDACEPVTLLTLGPLTNLAIALAQEPALADRIRRVYIMGGAVEVEGNVQYGGVGGNTVAEWNIFLDPRAAEVVFASGIPITLVGLDVTNQAPVTQVFFQRLGEHRQTPAAEFVFAGLTELSSRQAIGDWYHFWDPLAAVIATEPTLAVSEPRALRVVTEEGPTSGQTKPDSAGPEIDVVISVAVDGFEAALLGGLNGKAHHPAD